MAFGARITDYVSVLVVGPILIFSVLVLTATVAGTAVFQQVASIEPLGFVIYWLSRLLPPALVETASVFAYAFIPNTEVFFSCRADQWRGDWVAVGDDRLVV